MTIINLILQFIRNKVILLRFAHYLKKWYGISIMRSRRLSRPNPDHRRRVPMAKKHILHICVQLLVTTTFIQLVITQRLLLSGLIPKRSTGYMSHITNRNFEKLWSVFPSSYSMKKSEAFFFWGTASKVFTTHSNIYDEAFRHHRCLTGLLISLWIAMLNKSWETQDLHHQRCMENTINYPRWSFSWTYLIDEGR